MHRWSVHECWPPAPAGEQINGLRTYATASTSVIQPNGVKQPPAGLHGGSHQNGPTPEMPEGQQTYSEQIGMPKPKVGKGQGTELQQQVGAPVGSTQHWAGAGHSSGVQPTQTPFTHFCPGAHGLPHDPQLLGSVCVLTQLLLARGPVSQHV
jgi:hypothetical protein